MTTTPEQLEQLETPCYLFRPDIVLEDLEALRAALGTGVVVSFKANPFIDLFVRCCHAFTDGVELASLGELNAVVGRSAVPKFVNTPALDKQLLMAALACRATVVLDSADQVELAAGLGHAGLKQRGVWLRLNAASLCGSERSSDRDHFGMDVDTACAAVRTLADKGIVVTGLHVHAGSNSFARLGVAIARALSAALPRLEAAGGRPIECLNLGGGIPANWQSLNLDFETYRAALRPLSGHATIVHEAGRAIFARAGSFITRVVATKDIDGHRIAVCDGGISQAFLLARTEQFPRRKLAPRRVAMAPESGEDARPLQIVGNSCNRADVIGDAEGAVAVRDYFVFDYCGAYHTYSPVKFLSLEQANLYIAP